MAEWTMARVQDRLESAADVMRQLPGVRPQGYFNAWPEYFHSFADKVGQKPEMRRPRPGPRAITEAEEAMLWLSWLEVGGRAAGLGAGPRRELEGALLAVRHQPDHRRPALAVRAGGDRLAAERAGAASAAREEVGDRAGALSADGVSSSPRSRSPTAIVVEWPELSMGAA